MNRTSILTVVVCLILANDVFAIDKTTIDQLTDTMLRGCSLGQKFEIAAEADGSISFLKRGAKGSFKASKSEIPAIVNFLETDIIKERLATNTRQCVQRYLDRIFDAVLASSTAPVPKVKRNWKHITTLTTVITTGNHHCESNCRGEPTRTGYSISLSAPSSEHPRKLENARLRCEAGPCAFSAVMKHPELSPDGLNVSAHFDVWSKPMSWKLSAHYYEKQPYSTVIRRN